MADASTASAKHVSSVGEGSIVTDIKNLSSLVKSRRSVAFAYGFMFAFVAFTFFLAFSPSPNSYSPWFSNIFASSTIATNRTGTSSLASTTDSYGSQFASIFSYFFPKDSSFEPHSPDNGSNTNSSQPTPPIGVKNETLSTVSQTNPSLNNSIVNKPPPPMAKILTQSTENSAKVPSLKHNQTLVPDSGNSVNTSTTSATIDLAPSQKGNNNTSSWKEEKGVGVEVNGSNYTASLAKKQGNGSSSSGAGKTEKKGVESLVKELVNCDLFDGEWVMDESYPLYKPGSCSLIDEQFRCILNGRPDKDYQKYKWKPKGCTLPRLNPGHMLDMLRGKRLAFVGDSLNRNMWESLVCILKGSVKDKSKVFEANGRQHFKGEASYSFVFKDYGCTVEFFVSPFLVREWEMPDKNGLKKETLRLDLIGGSSDQYKDADIIIFNTGHWWTHEKTSLGKDYYQEGNHVHNELNVLEAFRRALTTWARWVDANINPMKSLVFFRGYSASHFSGGQWNSGGACDNEVGPIKNSTYLNEYPPMMLVLEKVMGGMRTHVKYLNVTRMTDYRKDGHPSIYRKQNLSEEEQRSPLRYQDCSHWCLPGVPDIWNEILFAELLINKYQKQQVQKRHR